jgi:glyoxylase-like metal-dependent hydrolase (beta-lactamase superfamily II)
LEVADMSMDRREFSMTLALASAAGLVRPRALFGSGQQATVFDWRQINDAMHVAFGAGGNVLAVAGGGNTLLIDTKNAGYGQVLRQEAEAFGGPLTQVVNTHHHGDHIGGNPFFTAEMPVYGQSRGPARAADGGEGTLLAIQEDPVGRLERMSMQVRNMDIADAAKTAGSESVAAFVAMAGSMQAAAFSATETFDTEHELTAGDIRVELRHIDRGHTDNDVFVYIPQANVIHGGDLFFNGLHPFIDTGADATTMGWQRCLDAMIAAANNDTVCIPGHGEISDVAGLRAFHGYFDTLRAFVQREIDAGRSRDQITEMQPPEFRDWSTNRLSDNLGVVYDELTSGR